MRVPAKAPPKLSRRSFLAAIMAAGVVAVLPQTAVETQARPKLGDYYAAEVIDGPDISDDEMAIIENGLVRALHRAAEVNNARAVRNIQIETTWQPQVARWMVVASGELV